MAWTLDSDRPIFLQIVERIQTNIVSGRYRFTIGDETREVGPGDTLLKQDGVMHGCVCLEGGVMLDFFTPMREDFV